MSNREKVIALLDSVPDYKMGYVLAYVQGITADERADETPNSETLKAMEELDSGGGHRFTGSTEQLFSKLMED